MENWKRRILALFMSIALVVALLPNGFGASKAEAATNLTFAYRYGANNLIQVNTNLPASTPIANFLAGDNGCNIDQSGSAQNVGWIAMANANGTIVLTFNFNSAFTAGQTYVLKKGSVFGFTDGSSYTLDANYTFTWDGSAWGMEKVVPVEPLEFGYRYGANNLIQVNTNLPSTTPCVNFTADQNGCNIDQSAGDQQVGWIQMLDADGTIVLTFHFNKAFEAGQTYILKQGSVFGFTDKKTYTLDKDYVFTWDGSTWTVSNELPVEVIDTLEFAYRYGANNLIQVNTNLPSTTPCVNFTADQNGCDIDQSLNEYQQVGWIGMDNVDGTIVLTFHFNSAFEAGQTYILKQGSVFGFTDGKSYPLDKDYVFTWDGSTWTVSNELPVEVIDTLEFAYRYGANNLIQVNTNLPASTTLKDFLVGDNGCNVDESASAHLVGYISMANADGTIVLTFNFNESFNAGEAYVLKQGSVFGFTDGTSYTLDQDYFFTWDGTNWTMTHVRIVGTFGMQRVHYGTDKLVQTLHAFSEAERDAAFTQTPRAEYLKESGNNLVDNFQMHEANKDLFQINFKGPYSAGETYVLEKGSMVQFADGIRKLDANYILTYNGGEGADSWTCQKEGDANIDYTIDSRDLVSVKTAESVTPVNLASCDIIVDAVVDHWDTSAMRQILLDTYDRHADVTSSGAYLLDAERFNGGGEFVTFADRPADPTNQDKIDEYKAVGFNTSLVTGEYGNYQNAYVKVTKGEKTYQLQSGEQSLELTSTGYLTAGMFQVATNLPTDGTYGDFLPDAKPEFEYATSNGTIGYFQYAAMSGKVYLNPIYNGNVLKDGESFTYKAGSKFQAGDTWYALEADYTVTYCNDYQAAIKNLDAAGLNVWIRNTGNNASYFTDDTLALLQPYTDVIDGIYMNDEPYETEALYTYSKTNYNAKEVTQSFATLGGSSATWFNTNFANKYFHVNQVPITSYNHYGESTNLSAVDVTKYNTFFNNYVNNVLDNVETSNEKKIIGFDNYPFGYSSTKKILWWTSEEFNTVGLEPTYLVNLLVPAQVAKNGGNTFSVCIQTFDKITKKNETRVVDTKQEVTMQMYAAMACGADMFEYFLYNTLPASESSSTSMPGMIAEDGTKRPIYTATMNANKEALPFADVLKTFEWKGAELFSGTSNKNSKAKEYVDNNSSLNLVLSNSNDGVLNSASASDDILVGYYTKGGQDAYMIANFNDPKLVTGNNSVTLNFGDCTKARVYTGTASGLTSEIVNLTNGSYTFTLQPGGGCFVIPVKVDS